MAQRVMYTIVKRIEVVDGSLSYATVGYVLDDPALCAEINVDSDKFDAWIAENRIDLTDKRKGPMEYLEGLVVHTARTESTDLPSEGLLRIRSLRDL